MRKEEKDGLYLILDFLQEELQHHMENYQDCYHVEILPVLERKIELMQKAIKVIESLIKE